MMGAIMEISIILFILMMILGFAAWIYDLLHCKPHSELGQRILHLDENNNPIEDKKNSKGNECTIVANADYAVNAATLTRK